MTNPQRFFDLWIVETNTVYKEVPYTVVAEWLQQGRLLDSDQIKPSGTANWFPLGESPDFRPYRLVPEPTRPEDPAEALSPVEIGFRYQRPAEEEDEDVDMIPLIDVSLVLLVFFMLTAASIATASYVDTPRVEHGEQVNHPEALRIDIRLDPEGTPLYSLGVGDRPTEPDETDLQTLEAILERLKVRLERNTQRVELIINAERNVKASLTRDLILRLRGEPYRSKLSGNFYGATGSEQ
jgi:biopolymer transport protein ExbD